MSDQQQAMQPINTSAAAPPDIPSKSTTIMEKPRRPRRKSKHTKGERRRKRLLAAEKRRSREVYLYTSHLRRSCERRKSLPSISALFSTLTLGTRPENRAPKTTVSQATATRTIKPGPKPKKRDRGPCVVCETTEQAHWYACRDPSRAGHVCAACYTYYRKYGRYVDPSKKNTRHARVPAESRACANCLSDKPLVSRDRNDPAQDLRVSWKRDPRRRDPARPLLCKACSSWWLRHYTDRPPVQRCL